MKKAVYAILILAMGTAVFGSDAPKDVEKKPSVGSVAAIDDGFFVDGIEGWLKKGPDGQTWHFAPDKPIEAGDNKIVAAGIPLVLLPCAVREQMITLAGQENQLYVRLWAMFTQYKHTNYLYSVYFLPIREDAAAPQTEANPPSGTESPKQETSEEESIIPSHLLAQIKSTRTPDLKKFQQIAQVTGDINLIGRTGYIVEENGTCIFRPDGFGMKVDGQQLLLLPNEARQTAEKRLFPSAGRARYNVSGLITTCGGRTYLLLRRATRTFTHGNFTP
ncbi:MAG: hypothetical protein L0Y36_05515 [Planctomycetales bacterium]|nr:hypothetical protein [Planctomycetales bacterium]